VEQQNTRESLVYLSIAKQDIVIVLLFLFKLREINIHKVYDKCIFHLKIIPFDRGGKQNTLL